MFKHILLPTDGTDLSEVAIEKGIEFAKTINARVTGIHVKPQFHIFTYRTEYLEETEAQFTKDAESHSTQYLAAIERVAKKAGVTCDTTSVTGDHPHEAIIAAAREKGCDLIVMASHGRKGIQGLLIGSETQKVLTHSSIPVMVYR